ncbi:Uncharacterised protein [Acinetobacter baumannii]|nr:Uncharacterised protein [Acinetobacter baumannii]
MGCARSAPVAAPRCRRGTGRRPARRRGTLAARLPVAAPGPPGRAARERSGRRRGPCLGFPATRQRRCRRLCARRYSPRRATVHRPAPRCCARPSGPGPARGWRASACGCRGGRRGSVRAARRRAGGPGPGRGRGGCRRRRRAVRWPWRSRREESASVDWTCGIDQQWIF